MTERVHCFAEKLSKDSTYNPALGDVVGKVLPDGTIEGTNYKFKRPIVGGVAITKYSELEQDGENLVNPATGDDFTPGRNGYTNHKLGILVRSWMTSNDKD